MVQVGNEINHGMVWPEGSITHLDSMSQLISAGISAVKSIDPAIVTMLHVALGGQNDEAVFFMDQLLARQVNFDVIGLSYYPKWHGTTDDLRDNISDLVRRYNKDVIVVEYSAMKNEVNKIAFEAPGGKGKGTCIWEPLSTWEKVFDNNGKANDLMGEYDDISKTFIVGK
jgi:beta-galactosidase